MSKSKKTIMWIAIGTAFTLVGFTIASTTIYHANLPVVYTIKPRIDTIDDTEEIFFTVVPAVCVMKDMYGTKVLSINKRAGLFGEELFIEEIRVTVLATNEDDTALGQLHFNTDIVEFASSPVENGDVVRLGVR